MQSVIAPTESGLALAVRGSGPDVVLVHGSLGDYRQWNAIVERFESNYRVIAVSRRYHGQIHLRSLTSAIHTRGTAPTFNYFSTR